MSFQAKLFNISPSTPGHDLRNLSKATLAGFAGPKIQEFLRKVQHQTCRNGLQK